jgi:hypothetical protein
LAQALNGNFEVVDLSGQILGEPELSMDSARHSWTEACRDWKSETKDLNKSRELLGINCNTAVCNQLDYGKNQCSSTGTYQVKTPGTRVTEPVPVVQAPQAQAPTQIVTTSPEPVQQIMVEEPPPPRFGYLWVPGFWGRSEHRHYWNHGYWRHRDGYCW